MITYVDHSIEKADCAANARMGMDLQQLQLVFSILNALNMLVLGMGPVSGNISKNRNSGPGTRYIYRCYGAQWLVVHPEHGFHYE